MLSAVKQKKSSDMKHIYFVFVSLALFSCIDAFAENVPVFTNESLEKYGSKKPSIVREEPENPKSDINGNSKTSVEQKKPVQQKSEPDKDYWCNKAMELERKIDAAKNKVKAKEQSIKNDMKKGGYDTLYGSMQGSDYKDRELELMRADIENAERELEDFQNEAHRKSIPPGWLRCQ